jgi:hypothetical protein
LTRFRAGHDTGGAQLLEQFHAVLHRLTEATDDAIDRSGGTGVVDDVHHAIGKQPTACSPK